MSILPTKVNFNSDKWLQWFKSPEC